MKKHRKLNNIIIITSWSFDDALIQTYTLPYIKIIQKYLPCGSKIYLYTQQHSSYFINKTINDTHKKILEKEKIYVKEKKYRRFGFYALIKYILTFFYLLFLCYSKKITTIHAWCSPSGAMGYFLSIITGKKLVLDSFEPHAEPMVENGTWRKKGFAYRLLFMLEKRQLKQAHEVICTTKSMIEYSKKTYAVVKKRYFVKPACVDIEKFSLNKIKNPVLIKEYNIEKKIVCVYAGKFGGLYLEKEIFEFFKVAYNYWNSNFKVFLLSNQSDNEIIQYTRSIDLPDNTIIKKFVKHDEMSDYMGIADFALCPIKPVPSKKFCTPIKNGEYWALGLPVIISRNISDDSDIVEKNDIGYVLKSLNTEEYKNAIIHIEQLLNTDRVVLQNKIRDIAIKYRSYNIAHSVYKEIYGNNK